MLEKIFSQTRKPEGFLGRLMVSVMNGGSHASLADWGMAFLREAKPRQIADLGCGGGRNADELLKRYSCANLTAVDYSEVSAQKAREYNKEFIAADRCVVIQGNVAALPFEDESFDLITAFETIYFWPGLKHCFSEVSRSLKPGGAFLIVNESDGTDATGQKFEKIIDGMKAYTEDEIDSALRNAGFSAVEAYHHKSKPWIAVLARK